MMNERLSHPISSASVLPVFVLLLLALLAGPAPAQSQSESESALARGETQLRVILKNRPQLATILRGREELRQWLVAELNRENPSPLWDPTEPVSGRAAEHEYPSRGGAAPAGTAVIRVSSRRSGWDQLAGLVFELHNIRRSGRFAEIYRAAVQGEIGKDEFVRRSLEEEFAALRATHRFLERRIGEIPESVEQSSPLLQQIMETGDSFEAHLEQQKDNGEGLAAHFERLYEREVLPERQRMSAEEPSDR